MDASAYIKTTKVERIVLETNSYGLGTAAVASAGSSSSGSTSSSSSASSSSSSSSAAVGSGGSAGGDNRGTIGTLHVTAEHLLFSSKERKEIWISYMLIESVEKRSLTARGTPLRVRCKDFRDFTFIFPRERECSNVHASIMQLAFPTSVEQLAAFTFKPAFSAAGNGWDFYSPVEEFSRMGLPNERWTLTTANMDYSLCPTYSRQLFVPVSASDELLQGSAKFRSKGRLPVLSYFHPPTHATITRCSQPLVGIKQKRSAEDERLVQAIFEANPSTRNHYIVDARPKKNAYAQKAGGKGYESLDCYPNCRYLFMDIENIHVMRDSLNKLIEAIQPNTDNYLSTLESSGWIKHIKAVMDASVFIANAIVNEGASCVVHCSDGWDRTAQLIALAEVMIDPYYRTLDGFQVVIEKEWLWSGHKFVDRCGFLEKGSREVSPVFVQFLDTIWQLLRQFPASFEFNERYLVTLHELVFSCQYGTFLGNCEQARNASNLSARTTSVWSYVAQHRDEFINPLYDGTGSNSVTIIRDTAEVAQENTRRRREIRIAANRVTAAAAASAVEDATPLPPPAAAAPTPTQANSSGIDATSVERPVPARIPAHHSVPEGTSTLSSAALESDESSSTSSGGGGGGGSSLGASTMEFLSNISSQLSSRFANGSGANMLSSPMVGDGDTGSPASYTREFILGDEGDVTRPYSPAPAASTATAAVPQRIQSPLAASSSNLPAPTLAVVDKSYLLRPSTAPQRLAVWTTLYGRTLIEVQAKESLEDRIGLVADSLEQARSQSDRSALRYWTAHYALDSERARTLDRLLPYCIAEAGPAWDAQKSVQSSWGKASAAYTALLAESVLDDVMAQSLATSENIAVLGSRQLLEATLARAGGAMKPPPAWQNDRHVRECTICQSLFDPISRKHHCRNCGQVVCFQCANTYVAIPHFYLDLPVRVCRTCAKTLK